jgi:DNA-binding transcriptional ArsR family regulator
VSADRARDGWEALGDSTRRAIVTCLADRPRSVGEIAEELPITRQAVSQHLQLLKQAGLVTDRAFGTRRVYRLSPEGLGALRDQLDSYWRRALNGYQDVAEHNPPETGAASTEETS